MTKFQAALAEIALTLPQSHDSVPEGTHQVFDAAFDRLCDLIGEDVIYLAEDEEGLYQEQGLVRAVSYTGPDSYLLTVGLDPVAFIDSAEIVRVVR